MMTVKPLEWEEIGSGFYRAKAPLFGNIRVEKYGERFTVCYSLPGYSDTFTPGDFTTADEAKAAAQADYEARILAALTNTSGDDEAPVAITDDLVRYISRYGGRCRDCADEDGVCPTSGLPCGGADKAIRHVLKALNYGVANGFIAALARPQSAAVRDGWRPIDTAPKDGTSIVGYGADYVGCAVAHVTRHVGFVPGSLGYAEGRKDTWWEYVERHTCFHWKPTHWMPLPAAPALHSTQEG